MRIVVAVVAGLVVGYVWGLANAEERADTQVAELMKLTNAAAERCLGRQ